jgi:hypothetical protein
MLFEHDGVSYLRPPAADSEMFFGRIEDLDETEKFIESIGSPVYELNAEDDNRDVFFWEAEEILLGGIRPAHRQTIGDCVSHGTARAAEDLLMTQMFLQGRDERWIGEMATEIIYAGSRVEIGGGRVSGDGSVGSWAMKWLADYGLLPRGLYGSLDLRAYNGTLARELGRRGAGVPNQLEPEAKLHPVKGIFPVRSADEVWNAIGGLCPVVVCSNLGFRTVRDSLGFCAEEGSWAHCMGLRGRCTVKGGRRAFVWQQSWGNSPTGNNRVALESGRDIVLPQGCFLSGVSSVDRAAKQNDTFALKGAVAWKDERFRYWSAA